jgi:hypothetical protein
LSTRFQRTQLCEDRVSAAVGCQFQPVVDLAVDPGQVAQQRARAALFGRDTGKGFLFAADGERERVGHGAQSPRMLGVQARRQAAVGDSAAGFHFGLRRAALARLAQHDVDGAGHRLAAGLGGGRAQDLDALDQIRIDGLQRKAGGGGQAVQQHGHVACTQPAHADGRLAGRAVDADAGLALEHVDEAAVALAQDLVARDDDGGGGRLRALLEGAGADRHLLHGLVLRGSAGMKGEQQCCGKGGACHLITMRCGWRAGQAPWDESPPACDGTKSLDMLSRVRNY